MRILDTNQQTISQQTTGMKNPTRWMQRTISKITKGVSEAARGLERTAVRAAMHPTSEKQRSLAIEILVIWIRRLIVTAIELGLGWLVRKITTRQTRARVISFPTPHPAA